MALRKSTKAIDPNSPKMKRQLQSLYFAALLCGTVPTAYSQNVLYSYCDGWDVGDLTNGVMVHFGASLPDGTDASITVNDDGNRVCFEMHAIKGVDTYARQLDCGQMQVNTYTPTGPSLITFGPFDSSGTVPESGSVVISYAGGAACPHGWDVVTLHGDVYIGSAFSEPDTGNQTKQCDLTQGGDAPGCQGCKGMARYSAHAMLASLHIQDTPIGYTPPRGPAINFTVTYNQREAQQPGVFSYSNLGWKWTFNWLSYVTDDPNNTSANAKVYASGGGTEVYTGFDSGTQSYSPEPQSHAVLVRTSSTSYEKRLPDGSKQVFSLSDGSASFPRKIFMTQWIDAAGNAAAIGYDASSRVTTITDALGQVTTISYELASDPLKITKVTEPFSTGRYASFGYDANGQLTSITDEIGIQSIFTYATDGTHFITALQTPYGTSTFATGQSGATDRWVEMTDPVGGKERVEYRDSAPGIAASDGSAPAGMTNSGLDVANTFYWDKKSIEMYPPVNGVYDYTKARVTHWAYNANGSVSGITASEKAPLENRVWYSYAGQSDTNHAGSSGSPSQIARILDDGSTQLSQFIYNSTGKVTQSIDPTGRKMNYDYDPANNIDLLTVRQTTGSNNELLRTLTYNSLHEPLTDKDPAGQTTINTYNSYGQILTVQNPKNEVTTYAYGDGTTAPIGYLASITSPVFNGSSAVTTFIYDSANRVRTVTNNPDGYAVTTDYDNLDRPVTVTYPDGTTQQFQYSQDFGQGVTNILDMTANKDRRGRWTYRHYNANRKMDSVTDPLSRTTQFGWCTCGSLTSVTDPRGKITTFNRDLESRIYQKVFHDSKSIAYVFENTTSRLKSMTDAKNQTTNYQYFADNNLKQVSYTNAQTATPTVNFTYDPNYNRLVTMADGTGTTTYAYKPITVPPALGAVQLQSIDGPLLNDIITYSYDELGRELSAAVNGTSASRAYDSLGRVSSVTNPLGTFTNSFDSVTPRLLSTALPNGQLASYSYFSNTGDRRLQTINNTASGGAIISKFDYLYDVDGEISKWTRQFGTANGIQWNNDANPMNDLADQLTSVIERDAVTQALRTSYSYGYDFGGNRTSDNSGAYTINDVNQITNSGYTYDNNGNLTADPFRTYEWDAADRLVAINYTGIAAARTEFTYDGLSRRVKIVEKGLPAPALSLTIQPANSSYGTYTTSSVSLSAGTYTLTIQGLNPNGGDNTALVDAVKLNTTLVTNGGFETPVLANGTYQFNPTGATWTFTGTTGIARNNSAFTNNNPNAPEGKQVGIVQMTGSISQPRTLTAGTYNLNLRAAQRGSGNATFQQIKATLQSTVQVVTSTKQFIWNRTSIIEERDGNNGVLRRFYQHGEQISGGNYYYTRDHLGSVRELTDSTNAVRARYDYDPYGNRTKLGGDLDSEFGYTGHYFHQPSGLNVSLYRAYAPSIGRWLSRDPIAERGGLNLYGYVRNNPVHLTDPLGLQVPIPGPAPTPGPTPPPPPRDGAWYGNYCGPGGSGVPIDCLDRGCKDHDDCYARCGASGIGGVMLGGNCVQECDRRLCEAAKNCGSDCHGAKANAARDVIMAIFCTTKNFN
jgi:RHS repeat-associated protein